MLKVIVKENGADVKDSFFGMGRGGRIHRMGRIFGMKRMRWGYGCRIADLIL